ncbi:MAG: hypothetical protein KC983_00110 [Phycisphaerales bacterium]|nr:hypothetical protein [Phycisphaerales bacterium]
MHDANIMQVLIIGVGDAFTRRYFGSSAVVAAPEGHVLIDCPDLIHRALFDASTTAGWNIAAEHISDIIITHLHGDHCNGLEAFGFYRRILTMRDSDAPIPRLHTTPAVIERLWDRLAPAMESPMGTDRASTLEDYFEIHPMSPNAPVTIAGLDVTCRWTQHPIPTIGLRLSNGAVTFGWSGDTSFDPDHLAWLSAADCIVHECNLGPVHTHEDELLAVEASIRRRLHLIHLPDDFDAKHCAINVLHEGQVLTITPTLDHHHESMTDDDVRRSS